MPQGSRVEARIAAVCFSALGTSILSAWAVGSFAPGYAQTAAGIGLAFPLAAAALARLRRRGTRPGDAAPRPVRSHA